MPLSQLLLTCNFKMIKPKDNFLIFLIFFLSLSIIIASFPSTVVDWKIFFRKLHENHHVQLTVKTENDYNLHNIMYKYI